MDNFCFFNQTEKKDYQVAKVDKVSILFKTHIEQNLIWNNVPF
jgi:hypothetical protein